MLLEANIFQVMLHVLKLKIFKISESFKLFIGIKQGDPPSPFFFNIYMNDLCSDLVNSNNIDTPKIFNLAVACLFWTDDLVLIGESKEGLQQHSNALGKYCKNWKLSVNTDKTQVVIFNKNGKYDK